MRLAAFEPNFWLSQPQIVKNSAYGSSMNTLGLVVRVKARLDIPLNPTASLMPQNLTVAWQCSLVIQLEANA